MAKLEERYCVICGASYKPRKSNQKTCSRICAGEYRGKRYKFLNGTETEAEPKKETTAKAWQRMTPRERMALMTLSEIAAECERLHITYGQAQALSMCGRLPADFGKRSKHND